MGRFEIGSLSFSLSGAFVHGPQNDRRGLTHTGALNICSIHIFYCFGIAKSCTLGVSLAKITFENQAALRIISHCAERTCRYTHLAPDAKIIVNFYTVQRFIPVYCLFWADRHAGRILTLLAVYGQVKTLCVPFDDANTGQAGIANPVVLD
jgi:hypothetical protein